jgi:hypothetical protein
MRCAYLLAVAGCAFAAPAMAELPGSSIEEIVGAARHCALATSPTNVDAGILVELGWEKASVSSQGQEIETEVSFFSKDGKGPIIALVNGSNGCVATGPIKKGTRFAKVEKAFEEEFGAVTRKGQDSYFRIGSDIAVLTQTGTRKRPSFRIAVLEFKEN